MNKGRIHQVIGPVIDIKFSTAAGLCHDAQTHVNEFVEDFSALVMYEEK